MSKFDIDDERKPLEHKDSGGQIIKVGDIALYAMSSTRMALVTVEKICKGIIKVNHKKDTIPNGSQGYRDYLPYIDWEWNAQVWPSALYILKRDEENNI